MSESSPFPALMPGFDFLQGLVRQAGTALPGMNAWITPTLDPEELDKRISELRTVQFWLEQNARLLGTTIQGLEVQRMTLNTLRSMNVSMGDPMYIMLDLWFGSASGQADSTTPVGIANSYQVNYVRAWKMN